MILRLAAATLGTLALANPVAAGINAAQPGYLPDTCRAHQYQFLVGKPRSDVEVAAIEPLVRVIEYGQFVSMMLVPGRLDIWLDATGHVKRVECG
ncbi:MAG: I78 family peptidase inhibitor [Rhodobacter sp.]|nr:I78 family peptidase inhibitor [Rhodobacter sp.]